MNTVLVRLFLSATAVISFASCVDPMYGGGGASIGGGFGTYSTLPVGYNGNAYYYQGRYYSGGQYQTGRYSYQGRSYSDRYYHNGRYYYGGTHRGYGGSGSSGYGRSPASYSPTRVLPSSYSSQGRSNGPSYRPSSSRDQSPGSPYNRSNYPGPGSSRSGHDHDSRRGNDDRDGRRYDGPGSRSDADVRANIDPSRSLRSPFSRSR